MSKRHKITVPPEKEKDLHTNRIKKMNFPFPFLKSFHSESLRSHDTDDTHDASSTCSAMDGPPLEMTVVGIYTEAKVPRIEQLPKKYGLKHVSQDQVMCRRRMKTPSLESLACGDVEEDKKDGIEMAMFVPEIGLLGPGGENPLFFHTDLEEHDEDESDDQDKGKDNDEKTEVRIYEERAILFQAVEHYEKLLEEQEMSKYFRSEILNGRTKEAQPQDENQLIDGITDIPLFGEQLIVKGCDSSQIAIGDVFVVEGGLSPLKIEVTSPRLSCAWVDKRVGSPFGLQGVKHYCNTNALGGWFTRVLVAGELRDGMKLVRSAHPHPKWTLTYISQALYAEGTNKAYMLSSWAWWSRNVEELEELCALEELGRYEWKDEARYILEHPEKYNLKGKHGRKRAIRKLEKHTTDAAARMQYALTIAYRALRIHRRADDRLDLQRDPFPLMNTKHTEAVSSEAEQLLTHYDDPLSVKKTMEAPSPQASSQGYAVEILVALFACFILLVMFLVNSKM